MQFVDRDNPYGDLVRDMRDDSNLPDSNKRYDFDRYLDLERRACENAMITFHSAFDDYEIYLKFAYIDKNKISS